MVAIGLLCYVVYINYWVLYFVSLLVYTDLTFCSRLSVNFYTCLMTLLSPGGGLVLTGARVAGLVGEVAIPFVVLT